MSKMAEEKKVAFLGLGAMGFGMATNLVTHGWEVVGFDVYAPTLERFVGAGGKKATTPREAVKGVPYVVFMVATAAQIVSALFDESTGAIHELSPNATVILCSTGPPEHTLNVRSLLDTKYSRADIHLIDAPVSGGTIRAANGSLTILAAGPEASITAAKSILSTMSGSNLHHIPGGLGAGTNVKMVHQVLAGIHIVMTAEAISFAAALGLNTTTAFESLKSSASSSWMFENRIPHLLTQDPKIHSALSIIVKDVGIITAAGRSLQYPLFLSSATEQVLALGMSASYASEDDSLLTKVYLPSDPTLVFKQASAASPPDAEKKLRLVRQIMEGVHLAAAAEAMSLGVRVGLDTHQLFEIISSAAGASAIFADRTPQLLSGEWTTEKTVGDVIAELSESMEEANRMKFPLHLTGTALQLFLQVGLGGSGKQPDLAICKVWEGTEVPTEKRFSARRM